MGNRSKAPAVMHTVYLMALVYVCAARMQHLMTSRLTCLPEQQYVSSAQVTPDYFRPRLILQKSFNPFQIHTALSDLSFLSILSDLSILSILIL